MGLRLEDFAAVPDLPVEPVTTVGIEQVEAEKAAAYEQGYSAGWDDAVKAEADAQTRIGTEFARHLQEMSFTFHEARAHVIASLEPVLSGLVETFLPAVVHDTIGQCILDTLEPLFAEQANQPVTIRVALGQREALQPYLDGAIETVVTLTEDPTLTEGQAFLQIGNVARKIDLTAAIADFQAALSALSQLNEKVLKHG